MNTKNFMMTLALGLISTTVFSQVGINTANPSSTLNVNGSFEGNYREITTTTNLNANDYHVSFSGAVNSILNLLQMEVVMILEVENIL